MMFSACHPQQQSALEQQVAPELHPNSVTMADGAVLPLKQWLPKRHKHRPKAVILALHGFNDYSQAFEMFGQHVSKQGMAVYAYDQRGFGAAPQPGIWPGNALMQQDIRTMLSLLAQEHPDSPLYLLGESMGGAAAITACAGGHCPELAGLMLVAPALWADSGMTHFYRFGLWMMAHTIPSSRWTGEDFDIMASDNIEMLRELANDPLVIKETRVDALYGLVSLMDEAAQKIPDIQHPVLMLYGANDQLVPPYPIAKALEQLQSPYNVAYYDDGYHMLLRDLQRDIVFKDMVHWMKDRYTPLPSGADMGWKEELLAYIR